MAIFATERHYGWGLGLPNHGQRSPGAAQAKHQVTSVHILACRAAQFGS